MEAFQQTMLADLLIKCELNIHYKHIQSYLFLYSKAAHANAMTIGPKVIY